MRIENYIAGDKKYKVQSMIIGFELWLHVNGSTHVIDLRPKAKKDDSKNSNEVSDGQVRAPMPGKILKVKAKKGDAVSANQTLIIMEAMKMEYSLNAPFAGTLKEISCQEGQQVELGNALAIVVPGGTK